MKMNIPLIGFSRFLQIGTTVLLMMLFFMVLQPSVSNSEFYEYIDENGVKTYTDDESVIHSTENKKIKVHKERYEHLDEQQKNELIQKEQQEIERLNRKTREDLQRYKQQEEAQKREQYLIEQEKRKQALKTPVIISRNRILVPVTIQYSGKKISTTLLLDTGASITTVNQFVAQELSITEGTSSAIGVVGGGILRTKLVTVDSIKVGPKTIKSKKIMVVEEKGLAKGYQGLLGQDFLQRFNYTIDYANSIIQWAE
ncbi:MAG: retroviral-like aspartic protease family protein [Pseudomonadota bacterium]